MRSDRILMLPPLLDENLWMLSAMKLVHCQTPIPKLAIKTLVGAVLSLHVRFNHHVTSTAIVEV